MGKDQPCPGLLKTQGTGYKKQGKDSRKNLVCYLERSVRQIELKERSVLHLKVERFWLPLQTPLVTQGCHLASKAGGASKAHW